MKPGMHKTDSPAEIRACLSCTKKECVNCLRENYTEPTGRVGRPSRPVVAIMGDEWHLFKSVKEAAEAFETNQGALRAAISNKRKCKGYYWRFA
jgi:hypothetical protein